MEFYPIARRVGRCCNAGSALPAQAQVVAIVGGEPITEVDIQQRSRLIELSTQKKPPRQEALDELIDDKLKVQLSKRYIAEVPKRDIETAFANMARRAGTPLEFAKSTSAQGVSPEAIKSRIHADFVWSQIVRGKFQGSLQVGDKEVEVKMQGTTPQDPVNYDTSCGRCCSWSRAALRRPLLMPQERCDALRARFQSCEEVCVPPWRCPTLPCVTRSPAKPPILERRSARC